MLNDRFAYMWGLFGEHNVWTYSICCNRVSEHYYVATFLAEASPSPGGFLCPRPRKSAWSMCWSPHGFFELGYTQNIAGLSWFSPSELLVGAYISCSADHSRPMYACVWSFLEGSWCLVKMLSVAVREGCNRFTNRGTNPTLYGCVWKWGGPSNGSAINYYHPKSTVIPAMSC